MAHVAKFARGATGHMSAHFERKKDEEGEYVKFGNLSIDIALSDENYNLAPEREVSQPEFIQQRCAEVQCLKRRDVKVLCSWVVTAPKEISGTQDEAKFFQEAYTFLQDKYGVENTVSAYVHKDEITPHMHFAFVPVVTDQRTGQLKVSAKECLPKSELKSFHTDLSRHMEKAFGRDIGVLNEATRNGNKSIEELKRKTAVKELQTLSAEVIKTQDKLADLQKTVLDVSELQEVENKAHKGMFDTLKGVKHSEYMRVVKTAARVGEVDRAVEAANKRVDLAERSADSARQELQQERAEIAQERQELQQERAAVKKAMQETPSKSLLQRNQELSAENYALKGMVQAIGSLLKYSGKVIKAALANDKPALEKVARIEKAIAPEVSRSRGNER